MNNLKGKKLLVLGATSSEITIIQRASQFGIYTIATDYNIDRKLSPAKNIADEAWDISWSDIDSLEQKCIECNIDGVIAGYSEFRVENLIKLCKRLNLPCYLTNEQLEITRDKIKFKETCRANGVPVVKEYKSIEEVNEFPVIVKPTDRAGSIGISIASNKDELNKACEYAMEMSKSKQIIIEKFIEHGTKFDLYYAVEDGEITLISNCDTINAKNNGYEKVVQSAWLYPSRYYQTIKKHEAAVKRMIKNMGIKYGCIFFSGFIEKNEIMFFECGFRLEGGHQFNYVDLKGPYNYLDLFIAHSLMGRTDFIPHKEINNNLFCVTLNMYLHNGQLCSMSGYDEISQMQDCTLALVMGQIGHHYSDDKAILGKAAMFQFVSNSPLKLAENVKKANFCFNAVDENGNDMVYDRVNADDIKCWW